jgi:hypothetical protein
MSTTELLHINMVILNIKSCTVSTEVNVETDWMKAEALSCIAKCMSLAVLF